MQIYKDIPYVKLFFLLLTILFHLYLLIRALSESRYLVAAILLIPVSGISIGLWKYLQRAVIRIRVDDAEVEIDTLFRKEKFRLGEIRMNDSVIEAGGGKKFIVKPAKAKVLAGILIME